MTLLLVPIATIINASIQVEALWYLDADGDGYYISSQLSCNSPGNGYVSSGVIAAGDCDDGNTAVSPVATELCGNSIDDNCNGQIDEDCCDVPLGLITSGISSNSAQLNWNTVTAANKYKIQYKKDAPGESGLPANVSAPATSYILTGLSSSTKYKWKVRSICTGGKSLFSSVKKFITASSKAGDVLNSETNFSIYPNPSTHSFVVDMSLNDGWNGDVDIQLLNELGQLVYTIRTTVNDGKLYSLINPAMELASGTYLVRVIAEDKYYTERLIIQQ